MSWAAALLLGYAAVLATAGSGLLRRAGWTQRAPRLGIAAWVLLLVSIVLTVVLAGTVMTPAGLALGPGAALRSVRAVAAGEVSADNAWMLWCLAVNVAALAATVWAVSAVASALLRNRRQRRSHAEALALVATPDPASGTLIVDHCRAAAYCVPGRPPLVVLTTAAIRTLSGQELAAVLAHERAHLSGRHHLLLAASSGLARAFPFVPAFRQASAELARLAEMCADDCAARAGAPRRALASAMLRMASGPQLPAAALAAAQVDPAGRALRLLQPARPIGAARAMLIAAALMAVAVIPTTAVPAAAPYPCQAGPAIETMR